MSTARDSAPSGSGDSGSGTLAGGEEASVLRRLIRGCAVVTVMAVVSACATGSALHNAQKAADHGDWDSAVAYYREALNSDPSRVDIKVALERAMRTASGEHLKRAKQLEEQDQLSA